MGSVAVLFAVVEVDFGGVVVRSVEVLGAGVVLGLRVVVGSEVVG